MKALYYTDGSANYTHVDDKTLNELTDRSLALPDGPERAKLFADIQRRLAALRPAVYLNDEEYLVDAARRVDDFQIMTCSVISRISSGIHKCAAVYKL